MIVYNGIEYEPLAYGKHDLGFAYYGDRLVWELGFGTNSPESSSDEVYGVWYNDGSFVSLDGVTEIEDEEFSGFDYETWDKKQPQAVKVNLPPTLVRIGVSAFEYNEITELVLPDGLVDIGVGAFVENQLTSVIIPEGVTRIEEFAFFDNLLKSVTIPDSVTFIGDQSFRNNQLTEVSIKRGTKVTTHRRFASFDPGVNIIYRP